MGRRPREESSEIMDDRRRGISERRLTNVTRIAGGTLYGGREGGREGRREETEGTEKARKREQDRETERQREDPCKPAAGVSRWDSPCFLHPSIPLFSRQQEEGHV